MVGSTLGVYSFGLIFVSARTNEGHHHLVDMAEGVRGVPDEGLGGVRWARGARELVLAVPDVADTLGVVRVRHVLHRVALRLDDLSRLASICPPCMSRSS